MNEKPSQQSTQSQSGNPEKTVKSKKGIAVALVVLILLSAAIAGVWYWKQQEVDSLSKQKNEVTNELSAAKVQKEKLSTKNEQLAKAADLPSETKYQAEVGKFSISLPVEYVVIEKSDSGGEGGPSTYIFIGDTTNEDGEHNVVNSLIGNEVSVIARPISGLSFRNHVDNGLDGYAEPRKQNPISVGGVDAEVYLGGGIGESKLVFFTANDIFYQITLENTDPANKKLDAIISDFKLN